MGSKPKSVVLLSGGLDSTVNFYVAKEKTQPVLALTFNYGQRAALQETLYAQRTCQKHGVNHQVVTLEWLRSITNTSLVNRSMSVPQNMDLQDEDVVFGTAKSVWVPNRNGVMINIAAAYAESLGADCVIVGFNAEEAVTFPDNSEEFLEASTKSLFYSTANRVKVKCFTSDLDKTEIVKLGREFKVDFNDVWSCYLGEDEPCGKCESCLRFQRALKT